ncbi:MAG: cytochrome c [Alphaproteobacteria bacterium]|nr:cytochrome c [Alphaproteobacteria bacterium]
MPDRIMTTRTAREPRVPRRLPAALATAALLVLLAPPGRAEEVGDAAAGRELARQWCSDCHLVESGARGATDYAPPFAEIAGDAKTTEFRLRAFLRTPHDRMPNYALSRDQTDNIIAYILSLRRR